MTKDSEETQIPDAFICNAQDIPVLALGFASFRFNLRAFHAYCRERGLPYQIWGSETDRGWYNPLTDRMFEREVLRREFGPMNTITALRNAE